MAKKNVFVDTDLTWDGYATTVRKFGKDITVTSANEKWNTTTALWTDDVVTILERILIGGSRGGVRTKQDTWTAWNKLDGKSKKKIVEVVLYFKGVKFVETKNINEYKITIEDIELILAEYEKHKVLVENVKIVED